MAKIKVKWFKQESAHRQTGHTHRRYQTYYLPCYAVDKYLSLLSTSTESMKQI